MFEYLINSTKMLLILTLLTGVLYPLAVTGISQVVFCHQANGSPILKEGKIIGSEWIGQYFDDPKYFWGRPSATSPAYNALASAGSNLGPTNKALIEAVESRVKILHDADSDSLSSIPADLVMSSGSGLDPHISIEAARYQIPRIAKLRGISEKRLMDLVNQATESHQWGILGQLRINVLKLNLKLGKISD